MPREWPAWVDGGRRPRGWPPNTDPLRDRLRKLRKLANQCSRRDDGAYCLGSFEMTIAPEMARKLWGEGKL